MQSPRKATMQERVAGAAEAIERNARHVSATTAQGHRSCAREPGSARFRTSVFRQSCYPQSCNGSWWCLCMRGGRLQNTRVWGLDFWADCLLLHASWLVIVSGAQADAGLWWAPDTIWSLRFSTNCVMFSVLFGTLLCTWIRLQASLDHPPDASQIIDINTVTSPSTVGSPCAGCKLPQR
jgi:hypothetical protein